MTRYLILLALLIALAVLATPPGVAGPVCGHYQYVQPAPVTYHQAATYTPYNTGHVMHYQQTYGATYYQSPVVVKEYKDVVLVPLVQPVIVNPDYYFSVRDYYRDAVALELAQTQRELLKMRQQMLQPQAPPQQPFATQTQPAPPQTPAPLGAPVPPGVPGGVATEVNPALQGVVARSCLDCHGGAKGTKGDLNMSALASMPLSRRLDCYEAVRSGRMPKGQGPLPDSEAKLFFEFARSAVNTNH